MRRIVFLAALLLIASMASAQAPKPTLSIERIAGPAELMPMERGELKLDVRFDCAMFESPVDRRYANVDVRATTPAIKVAGPHSYALDTSQCWQHPQARSIHLDVKLEVMVVDVNRSSIEVIRTTVSVTPGGNMAPAPDDAHAETTLALIAPEPELDLHAEVQDRAPAEEFAPGPALPLLALGGLAAARLRRP